MVPKEWNLGTIKDIALVSSGGTPSRKIAAYWNGDIPWATTTEVQFKVITNTSEKITNEGLKNSSAKLFPVDTILMAMYGQGKTRGQVAKLGIEATTNQACAAIIIKPEHCTDYFYQYLVDQYENIRDLSNKGGQENLSAGIVKSIKVLIPPLPEQKKISVILSTWDDAISANEDLLANSRLRKKALMQQLLTGKKRLPGFEGEWKTKPISDCGKVYSGGTPDTAIPEYWDGGINWLTPTDVTALRGRYTHQTVRQISESGLKHSSAKLLPPGSVMVCTRATVGEVAMAAEPICTNQGFKSIVPNEESSSEFLYYLLTSSKRRLLRLSSGSTFLELSKGDFDSLDFAMPSIDEQRAIAAVLTTADEEIETLEQRINNLKLQKKALMQQLLTGKKRVKVEPVTA